MSKIRRWSFALPRSKSCTQKSKTNPGSRKSSFGNPSDSNFLLVPGAVIAPSRLASNDPKIVIEVINTDSENETSLQDAHTQENDVNVEQEQCRGRVDAYSLSLLATSDTALNRVNNRENCVTVVGLAKAGKTTIIQRLNLFSSSEGLKDMCKEFKVQCLEVSALLHGNMEALWYSVKDALAYNNKNEPPNKPKYPLIKTGSSRTLSA